MRKILSALSLITLLLLSFTRFTQALTPEELPDQAEERRSEIQSNLDERRKIREDILDQLREKISQRRATREAQLAEFRKERIRNYWQRLNRRIIASIDRLEKLISRIESRIAKIEEGNEDIDTSAINEQIDEAKEILVDARAEKEAADIALEEILQSQDPKDTFKVIRDEVQKIKTKLVNVHRILVHVIGDIKGLRVGNDGADEDTPTPSFAPTLKPTEEPTPVPTVT